MVRDLAVGPVPLDVGHDVEAFECSSKALQQYLVRRALADQHSRGSLTYVLAVTGRVIAYASLVPGVVEAALSRDRVVERGRRQVVPVVVLSRIAVDRRWQREGIGRLLLAWAVNQAAGAAQVIGARALVTTGLSRETRSFLEKGGFVPFPGDVHRLYMPLGVGV
jgi:GNAT superfamily N-acetyltransferase